MRGIEKARAAVERDIARIDDGFQHIDQRPRAAVVIDVIQTDSPAG
jgi:hypothetical protein